MTEQTTKPGTIERAFSLLRTARGYDSIGAVDVARERYAQADEIADACGWDNWDFRLSNEGHS